jgi:hypothetical protein
MMAKKPIAKPEVIAPVKPAVNPPYNPLSGMTPTPAATPVSKPTYPSDYAASSKAAADAVKAAAQQKATEAESIATANTIAANAASAEAAIGTTFGQAQSAVSEVPGKTITGTTVNANGSVTITYSDGTTEIKGGPDSLPKTQNKSAFDLITLELKNLGLETLIEPLAKIFADGIEEGDSLRLALAGTEAYKTRFKANEERIKAGFRSLSPAEYIRLEDQYQNVMRNYGLPASYYTKDATGKQVGFEKLIAGDVSNIQLEERIATAQNRVLKANPEVSTALKQFYPDITNGDILAYTLDPTKGLEDIKRKVTAAEIGGAALQAGLTTGMTRAEELRNAGIDKAAATEGYSTIGAGLQRGSELASIYGQSPYTQTTAESEIFKLSGQQEARKQRQKVTGLEKAAFSGQTGLTSGALARDRAGGI